MSLTLVVQMESKHAHELELRAAADDVSVSEYVNQLVLPCVQAFRRMGNGMSFYYPDLSTFDAAVTVECSDELEQELLQLRGAMQYQGMGSEQLLYVFIGLHIEMPEALTQLIKHSYESEALRERNARIVEEVRNRYDQNRHQPSGD